MPAVTTSITGTIMSKRLNMKPHLGSLPPPTATSRTAAAMCANGTMAGSNSRHHDGASGPAIVRSMDYFAKYTRGSDVQSAPRAGCSPATTFLSLGLKTVIPEL